MSKPRTLDIALGDGRVVTLNLRSIRAGEPHLRDRQYVDWARIVASVELDPATARELALRAIHHTLTLYGSARR